MIKSLLLVKNNILTIDQIEFYSAVTAIIFELTEN